MKKSQGAIIALLIVCVLVVISVVMYISGDRTVPVITIDESKVKPYAAAQGVDVLKSYVSAKDAKDGDVSGSIIVENIYLMPDLTRAKVVYVARDKSNNVAKYSYMIAYEATEEERNRNVASSEETTVAEEETTQSETTAAEKDTTKAGQTTTAAQKTVASDGSPVITLSATSATIDKGDSFNVMRYVSSITDDKDTYDTLSKRVVVNGKYNTSVAGEYELELYCTDSDANESAHVKFTLVVK